MNQPTQKFGPPQDNWGPGHQQRKDPTMWVPAMIVGAMIFAFGCGGGMVVGWLGGAASGFGDAIADIAFEPTQITIEKSTPDIITAGESFDLVVVVTDTSGVARTIQDIDFSGTFCDNMSVDLVTPTPLSASSDPGYHEYVFESPLPANQSVEYVFRLTPNYPGVFTGDITVYVDDYNSDMIPISLVVGAED